VEDFEKEASHEEKVKMSKTVGFWRWLLLVAEEVENAISLII